jgi:hypothetical protein
MALPDALEAAQAELESLNSPRALPEEAVGRLREATLELIASGQARGAKHAGEMAPAFRLPGNGGASTNPVRCVGELGRRASREIRGKRLFRPPISPSET